MNTLQFLTFIQVFVILLTCRRGTGLHPANAKSSKYGEVGKNITLLCGIIRNANLRDVYWMKNGVTVLTKLRSGKEISSAEGKYLIADDTSLLITNLVQSDVGDYRCKLSFTSVRSTVVIGNKTTLLIPVLQIETCPTSGNGCDCLINGTANRNVTCRSSGWLQAPLLTWINQSSGMVLQREASWNLMLGLTGVWENSTFICRSEPFAKTKSVCVHFHKANSDTFIDSEMTRSSLAGWKIAIIAIVCIILVVVVFAICAIFWKKGIIFKEKRKPVRQHYRQPQSNQPTRTQSAQKDVLNDSDMDDNSSVILNNITDPEPSQGRGDGIQEPTIYHSLNPGNDQQDGDYIIDSIGRNKKVDEKNFDEKRRAASDSLAVQIILDDYKALTDRLKQDTFKQNTHHILKRARESSLSNSLVQSSVKSTRSFPDEVDGTADSEGDLTQCFARRVKRYLDSFMDDQVRDICELLITNPSNQTLGDTKKLPSCGPVHLEQRTGSTRNEPLSSSFLSSVVSDEARGGMRDLKTEMRDMFQSLDQPMFERHKAKARKGIAEIILKAYKCASTNPYPFTDMENTEMNSSVQCEYQQPDDPNERLAAFYTEKIAKLDEKTLLSVVDEILKKFIYNQGKMMSQAKRPFEKKKSADCKDSYH